MDPCPYVRITVSSLGLKIPVAAKPARSLVHPSSSPCFCELKLKNFPLQTAVVPYISPESSFPDGHPLAVAATFDLSKADLDRVSAKTLFSSGKRCLRISIYTGRRGATCGVSAGRLLGKVSVPLELAGTEAKPCVFHSGWVAVGGETKGSSAKFHLRVKAEPDPRFVFQFDGEPECSPQVFQIQGNLRQPVFTCKFSFRATIDRTQRSRSLQSETSSSRKWLGSFGSDRERPSKERKGWSVTVHDLSGSPVAAASMVTPFVASPDSDRVSRSNPGAWLILRPAGADGTWKPWGRLEAWRERGGSGRGGGGGSGGLGFRFELVDGESGVVLTESALSSGKGGKFAMEQAPAGFVMSARVEGEGQCSKPRVEVGVPHVSCAEDAAVFVALSAAVDLSVDACRLFSQNLRKELCHQQDNHSFAL